jgi:hypothetical protein
MFPAISDFPECQLQGDHQMLSFRLTISTAQRKDLGRKLKSAQQLGDHTTAHRFGYSANFFKRAGGSLC